MVILSRVGYAAAGVLLVALWLWSAQWRTVTSTEGKFRVEFPGFPSYEHKTAPTEGGSVTAYEYRLVQVLHGATYEAGFAQVTGGMPESFSSQSAICDSAVTQVGGTLVEQHDVPWAGHTAREVNFNAPGVGVARMRVLIVGTRIYTLLVSPVPKRDGEARAARFFASFKLLE